MLSENFLCHVFCYQISSVGVGVSSVAYGEVVGMVLTVDAKLVVVINYGEMVFLADLFDVSDVVGELAALAVGSFFRVDLYLSRSRFEPCTVYRRAEVDVNVGISLLDLLYRVSERALEGSSLKSMLIRVL